MHMELRDMKKLQLDDKGMIVSPPRRGKSQKVCPDQVEIANCSGLSKDEAVLTPEGQHV